jgi:hypothetical protein
MRKKEKRVSKSSLTDEFYASHLSVRSLPVDVYLANNPPKWVLPITSIDEDKLLRALKVPGSERSLIEGVMPLQKSSYRGGVGASNSVSSAIVRLAANPPGKVGVWQLRTASWLVRLFPHGLRLSGRNMTPLYLRFDSNHGRCTAHTRLTGACIAATAGRAGRAADSRSR